MKENKKIVKVTVKGKQSTQSAENKTPKANTALFSIDEKDKSTKQKRRMTTGQIIILCICLFMLPFIFIFMLGDNDSTTDHMSETTSVSLEQETTIATPEYGINYVILDDSFVTVRVQSVEKFSVIQDGVIVTFSVDNKSNQNLDILTKDIYVNDVKLEAYGLGANSGTVEPGKTGLLNLPFSYSRAFVDSYENLSTMQLSFNVIDHEDYQKQYTTNPVTFDLHIQ